MNLMLQPTDYDKTFQEFINFVMTIKLSKMKTIWCPKYKLRYS